MPKSSRVIVHMYLVVAGRRLADLLPVPPSLFFLQHQSGGDYARPPSLELRRERVEKRLLLALRYSPLLAKCLLAVVSMLFFAVIGGIGGIGGMAVLLFLLVVVVLFVSC